jgi:TolB-like protein/tetratricopeptide (TPR) repeat protein
MTSLFSELKRRNVFRVATAYVIVGWLLTEILATLMPMFGVPDWVGKAVVLVVAVTFIPVLIFAWAFEMTPEGIKREEDVDRDASITSQTGKKLNYVTIAAVILGVAFIGWSKTGSDTEEPAETTGAPSVAVLPFVNMSGNAENEYFSDGLTETLLHMLAQVPEIKVAARTSSFAFKGQEQDIRKIALALGVAHVLEGSVQRSGDKVRVTAQLIRADDGFHVWSSNYDRTLNDIFAIQDEIAADVGKSLTASLLGEDEITIQSIGTHNVLAYDLYLQALSHTSSASYEAWGQAEAKLKDALLLDPDFYDAKVLLAVTYFQQQATGLLGLTDAIDNGTALLEQVLSSQPDHIIAQAALIYFNTLRAEEGGAYMAFVDALPEMQKLVDAAPNDVDVLALAGGFHSDAGHSEESLALFESALEIDPINSSLHFEVGAKYQRLRNWDAAQAAYERSLELSPNNPNIYGRLANVSFGRGDAVAGIRHIVESMRIDSRDPELPGAMANWLYQFGVLEEADSYRDRATLVSRDSPVARSAVLMGAVVRNDIDESDRLARSMIVDDIDERHGSYFFAVYTVLRIAVERENAEEGLQFMEEHQPGFNDPTSNLIGYKVRAAQGGAFGAWYVGYGPEVASRMAEDVLRVAESSGMFLVSEVPTAHLEVLALRGDVEVAVDFALENVLTLPVTDAVWWRMLFDDPHMADVAADPRVQAGLKQWDEDVLTTRVELEEFFAGGEASRN